MFNVKREKKKKKKEREVGGGKKTPFLCMSYASCPTEKKKKKLCTPKENSLDRVTSFFLWEFRNSGRHVTWCLTSIKRNSTVANGLTVVIRTAFFLSGKRSPKGAGKKKKPLLRSFFFFEA